MKFQTKLWKRSAKSYATTIPHALLFLIEEGKRYNVLWQYEANLAKWSVEFVESKEKEGNRRFLTTLWKRSQRSYATTIPISVLIMMDEDKKYVVEWEFNKKIGKWVINLKND